MDFKNIGAKKVVVVTDKIVKELNAMKQVIEGLTSQGIEFTIYDGCRVEPKDSSYVSSLSTCPSDMIAIKSTDDIQSTASKKQSLLRSHINQMPSSKSVVALSSIQLNL